MLQKIKLNPIKLERTGEYVHPLYSYYIKKKGNKSILYEKLGGKKGLRKVRNRHFRTVIHHGFPKDISLWIEGRYRDWQGLSLPEKRFYQEQKCIFSWPTKYRVVCNDDGIFTLYKGKKVHLLGLSSEAEAIMYAWKDVIGFPLGHCNLGQGKIPWDARNLSQITLAKVKIEWPHWKGRNPKKKEIIKGFVWLLLGILITKLFGC